MIYKTGIKCSQIKRLKISVWNNVILSLFNIVIIIILMYHQKYRNSKFYR